MPHSNSQPKSMKCFVCEETLEELDVVYNTNVNLPVCSHCSGSEEETKRASELLEGLADGFVCGCI